MPSLTDLPTIEMIVNSGFYTVGLTGIVVFIIQLVLTVYLIVIPTIRRGRLSLLTLFVICLHVCCYMAILRGVIYPHDITPAESDWTMLISSSIMLLTATTGGHLHRNNTRGQKMQANWTETKGLWVLNGDGSHVVVKRETPNGFQFIVGKKSSYKPTIEEAKQMVEAIVELGRWPE